MNQSTSRADAALSRLRSFFAERKAWELAAWEFINSFDRQNGSLEEFEHNRILRKEQLKTIYEKYCEVGDKAKRLRNAGSYRMPTEYDPDRDLVTSVTEKSGKIFVEVEDGLLKFAFRYELIERDGE